MKILLILFLLFFLSSKSYSNDFLCKYFDTNCETVSFKKVQIREKKFYKFNSLKPFTGNIVINLEEFILVDYLEMGEEGKVIDGVRDGEWNEYKIYNKQTDLWSKEIYEHGKLIQQSFWENGILLKIRNYKNGELDGKYEDWSILKSRDLGIPSIQGNYKNGKKVGCWKFLDKVEYKDIKPDYYVIKECYNSKYIIDTEIYGIGDKTPLYSGKKNHYNCYSGEWIQYNFKGKIKEKIDLGECTLGGYFVPSIEKLFKVPYWSGFHSIK